MAGDVCDVSAFSTCFSHEIQVGVEHDNDGRQEQEVYLNGSTIAVVTAVTVVRTAVVAVASTAAAMVAAEMVSELLQQWLRQ